MKNIFRKRLALKGVLASLLFVSFAAAASADAPKGDLRLTTSSLPINLKVTPGTSASAPIKVRNDGTAAENIKVSLMKFKADENSGAPILMDRESGDTYFDWVTFSENNFSIAPNEWKTVTATFNVPADAAFDYYYAIVFSRAEQNAPSEGSQTIVTTGGTATMVLLEADVPNAKREVQVVDFSADKSLYEFLPTVFHIKLRNTGNVHVAPRGNIFISQGQNKNIAILEVNPTKGSILPNSPRDFQEKWTDGFPSYVTKEADGKVVLDGKGNPVQELKWNLQDLSKLRWGKYTAKMMLVYDNGNKDIPVEAEMTFWIIPWRLLGAALVVALLVLLGLKSTIQNFWRKITKKSSTEASSS